MKDFFDLLADFLNSDLAKNYYWIFIICAVMIMVATGAIVWFYASKIYYKIQNNEMRDLKKVNEELNVRIADLENENKEVLEQNAKLKKQLQLAEFGAIVSMDCKDEVDDPAMLRFIKKND